MSFFIESVAVVVFTGQPARASAGMADKCLADGNLRITHLAAFVPGMMTIVLVAILLYIVYKTKPGHARCPLFQGY